MKRWLTLLLTLTLSWNGFSQTVTESRDTTHIVLSTEVARKVALDLVEGDKAKQEVLVLSDKVEVLEDLVTTQDTMIQVKDREISDIQKLREMEGVILSQQSQEVDRLNRELQKQLRYKSTFQVATGVAAIALIVSLLVN